jgi:hypothetical protein
MKEVSNSGCGYPVFMNVADEYIACGLSHGRTSSFSCAFAPSALFRAAGPRDAHLAYWREAGVYSTQGRVVYAS